MNLKNAIDTKSIIRYWKLLIGMCRYCSAKGRRGNISRLLMYDPYKYICTNFRRLNSTNITSAFLGLQALTFPTFGRLTE